MMRQDIASKIFSMETLLSDSDSQSTRASEDDVPNGISKKEEILSKYPATNVERLEEGFEIREMMKHMPKTVLLGDEWFVYGMEWLKKWEQYVYFDLIDGSKPSNDERPNPGPVDCSDIILPADKQ